MNGGDEKNGSRSGCDTRPIMAAPPTSPRGPTPEVAMEEWQLSMKARATHELLGAFDLLAFRGTGNQAWAAPFRHDPIAFLLDTVSDAANVWAADERQLLYQNRAARALALGRCDDVDVEQFTAGDRWFERRSLRFDTGGRNYILEIIHQLPDDQNSRDGQEQQQRGR